MGDRILNGSRIAIVVGAALLGGVAEAAPGGRVVGKVSVVEPDGKQPATVDAIVYLVGFSELPGQSQLVSITQKGRRFTPDLVAITVGDRVAFPNGDSFLHNVFSPSGTRKFDLGSFKRGESKDKQFPSPGVVDVYCNIHPEMAATILVLPNRRHVRTAADGSFVLADVPPGVWTVFAYTRRAKKPASAQVKVVVGTDASVALSLTRGPEPEHVNKYGAKYHDGPAGTYR